MKKTFDYFVLLTFIYYGRIEKDVILEQRLITFLRLITVCYLKLNLILRRLSGSAIANPLKFGGYSIFFLLP